MKQIKSETEERTYNKYLKWRKNGGVENIKSKSQLGSLDKKTSKNKE